MVFRVAGWFHVFQLITNARAFKLSPSPLRSVPVIPVAGLTSLEGHFSAPYGGICVSFGENMDNIVAFHNQDMDIVVQPGVGWEDLNAFLKPHGMFFPLDPGPG
jgi:D-lactate dehydrogenase (cytochrome)